MAEEKPDDAIRLFCPRCFASDLDGSWGCLADEAFCANCGAVGCTVRLPAWAVREIRTQASWVGKRYYPHNEDRQHAAELAALRTRAGVPPDREAKRLEDGRWCIRQPLASGWIEIWVAATGTSETERDVLVRTVALLPFPV